MDNAPPPTNRLTLFHLLVWMAVTGVLYGLLASKVAAWKTEHASMPDTRTPEELAEYETQAVGYFTLEAITIPFQSIAFAGVLSLPWRRRLFRLGWPTQPGHWVMLACGTWLLVRACSDQLSSRLTPVLIKSIGLDEVNSFHWFLASSPPLFAGALLVFSLFTDSLSRSWSLAIIVVCVGLALQFGSAFLRAVAGPIGPHLLASQSTMTIGNGMLCLSVALCWIAVLVDHRQCARRDIFHYLGLIAASATIGGLVAETSLVPRLTYWL